MIQYFSAKKKMELVATSGTDTLSLGQVKQPFEAVTIVVMLKAASGNNVDITPTLNGVAVTAKKISAVATNAPQVITLDGIFPANKNDFPGVIPGVLVENKGAAKVAVEAHIIARSYGPGA